MTQPQLLQIAGLFDISGQPKSVTPLGDGLINTTYKVTTAPATAPDYVLQHINTDIFTDPDMLMDNITAVTTHLRAKLQAAGTTGLNRRCLQFCPTKQGKHYARVDNKCWRMMVFIPDTVPADNTMSAHTAYTVGHTFGQFQAMLADIPAHLGDTIPNFHNMEFRLEQLRQAVQTDTAGRLHEVQWLVDELMRRSHDMCLGERLHRQGFLPKRICHCDTKANNILFDHDGTVLCVIDLDTVMPNFIFSDFGDFLRTAANTGAEDDTDLSRVSFNIGIFRPFTQGYIESTRTFLTPVERDNLPYAACLFPYMQTVRFLADYLNGDTYYRTQYPTHNLVRSKAQFKLLQSAESQLQAMRDFIATLP